MVKDSINNTIVNDALNTKKKKNKYINKILLLK